MSSPLILVALAVLGLVAGPSLHHFGVRAGARRPFEAIRPLCETCGRGRLPLAPRCPQGHPIRPREPAIWALAAATFTAAGVVSGDEWALLPAYLGLAALSVVVWVTDVDHKLIPNRVLYPGTAATLTLLIVGALVEGRAADLVAATIGAGAYFGVLFGVYLVARGGFGFGDVKLAILLGAMTAFQSQRTILMAVFFTGVYGGVPAIVMLVTRRARLHDELPYGPPMIAGAWTGLVFGEALGRLIAG